MDKNLPANARDTMGQIPHVAEQLSPWATTTELVSPEPVLHNKRSHRTEKPVHPTEEEWPLLAVTREKPAQSHEDPVQPKIKK